MSRSNIKSFALGVVGAIAFFAILYLPFGSEAKNLLVGLLCATILLSYIVVARFNGSTLSARDTMVISLPTVLLLIALYLNYYMSFGIGGLYFWVAYAVFTALAMSFVRRTHDT